MKSFFSSFPKKVKKVFNKKKLPTPDTAAADGNTSSSIPQSQQEGGSANNTSKFVSVAGSSTSRNTATTKDVAVDTRVKMKKIFISIPKQVMKILRKKNKEDPLENSAAEGGSAPPSRFSYSELYNAAEQFSQLLGKGGFGNVYKGRFNTTNKDVAIKQLNGTSEQGHQEFTNEVEILSKLQHRNIIQLIGYCAENEHMLLVYEYMPLGSLDKLLFERPHNEALDWETRIRIATEVAAGLEYMHDTANPRVIFRDMKCANILLGDGYTVKLSDFGHARELAPGSDTYTVEDTKGIGTLGYCCPHYLMTSELTLKSDIYSFGVVLLELITGIRTLDEERPIGERNLILSKQDIFRDQSRVEEIVDPWLQGQYPLKQLQNAFKLVVQCTERQDPEKRPSIGYVVNALANINSQT